MPEAAGNKKYKELLKNILIFGLGSYGSKIILFFLLPLYTNYLTRAQYGQADLIETIYYLVVPVTSLKIYEALMRFGMMEKERKENVALASFLTVLLSVGLNLILVPIYSLFPAISPYKWHLFLSNISANFSMVGFYYLKVIDRNLFYAITALLWTGSLALAKIVCIVSLDMGVAGYLDAIIFSNIVSMVLPYLFSSFPEAVRKGHIDRHLWKAMILFSAPLALSRISWWLVYSSDKIMLQEMIGSSTLGVYTVASKLPALINVFIEVFNLAWGISSIKEMETEGDSKFYSSVFHLYSSFVTGICMIILAVLKPFMRVYVGSSFQTSWQYAVFLLVGAVFYAMAFFIGELYAALRRTKNDMVTAFLCAGVNVVVNYFGIRAVGIWGAVLGTFVAYLVFALVRIIDVKQYMYFRIDVKTLGINIGLLILQAFAVALGFFPYLVSIAVIALYFLNNRTSIRAFALKGREAMKKLWAKARS